MLEPESRETVSAENKRAVIIGATGGIGSELCRRLAGSGWEIVAAARDEQKLDDLRSSLGGSVVSTHSIEAHDPLGIASVFAEQESVSAAVNLCGSILIKPLQSCNADDLDHAIDQNIRTSFYTAQAAAKSMRKSGGSVVLMSSCAARLGLPNHEIISAAKGAVEGLVKSAAASFASAGIRFNAVAPGLVDTPLASRITASEQALKASVSMHPLGRIGKPADIARIIEFLIDPMSDWVTGQVIGVDGGLASIKGK